MIKNYNAESAHRYIDQLLAEVETAEKKVEQLSLSLAGGSIMPMKPYKIVERFYSRYYDVQKEGADRIEKELNKLYSEDLETIKENEIAAANNRAIYDNLHTLFTRLGFKESIQKGKKTESAGWIQTIRTIRTDSGADNVYKVRENVLKKVVEERERMKRDAEAKKRIQENEQKHQELMKFIGTLEVKYNQKFQSVHGAREFILSQNKYLRLAYWLERNRGDWNDGANYASIGIRDFKIETETDKEIFDEISGYINDWCGDGRVFRDCEWNYRKLYEASPRELREELERLGKEE